MLRSFTVLVFLVLTTAAAADDFEYTYVSLGYADVDHDNPNVNGNGVTLDGSIGVNDYFHVVAGYTGVNYDRGIDSVAFRVGVGYNTSLSRAVDLVARLSYQKAEFDVPGGVTLDDHGPGAEVGVRVHAGRQFEVNATLSYLDLSDSGDSTGFGVAGWYNFANNFAVGLGADWADDTRLFTLSGRLYFDN